MAARCTIDGTFFDLDRALKAAHRRVERLISLERRIDRVVMPYAAAIIQEGVRLHMAGRENPRGWKRLVGKHGVRVKADAISPCHAAAKLVFAHAPRSSVGRYAAAMAWAWERVKAGAIKPDQVAAYVVREGGVTAIALAYLEKHGRGNNQGIGRSLFDAVLGSLPDLGYVTVRNPGIELADAALAVVRRDPRGRLKVSIVEQDLKRVRATVVRFGRRDRSIKAA